MKLLLVGGTKEARVLAGFLAISDVEVVASLAGVTRRPAQYPVPARVGGFGGKQAQRDYIKDAQFDAIIDASHPFARVISRRTEAIARDLDLPYLRMLRPAWEAQEGDTWHAITSPQEAGALIPKGARILLATGAKSVCDWATVVDGRTSFCRRIDAPDTSYPFEGGWIVDRPPFTVKNEISVLKNNRIDWVIAKNAGGETDSKLTAARELGVPVVLLERPQKQSCTHVETAEEAVLWVIKVLG